MGVVEGVLRFAGLLAVLQFVGLLAVLRFAGLLAVLQFVGLDVAADLVTVKPERMVKDVLA